MKTLVNKIFPHGLLCGPHEAEKHVPMFRNLHYKLSEFGAFFFGLFFNWELFGGATKKKRNCFRLILVTSGFRKTETNIFGRLALAPNSKDPQRVCNTDATCGRLFFKLHQKSAKWQLVWQSEDAMEKSLIIQLLLQCLKQKVFRKNFKRRKRKSYFRFRVTK